MTAKQNQTVAALRATFGTSEFMFDFRHEYAHAGDKAVTAITARAFAALQSAGAVVLGSSPLTYRLA